MCVVPDWCRAAADLLTSMEEYNAVGSAILCTASVTYQQYCLPALPMYQEVYGTTNAQRLFQDDLKMLSSAIYKYRCDKMAAFTFSGRG